MNRLQYHIRNDSKPKKTFFALSFVALIFIVTVTISAYVNAGTYLNNSSFVKNLENWNVSGDADIEWVSEGYDGEIYIDGITRDGTGGSIRFQSVTGDDGSVSGSVYQSVYVRNANAHVKLSLAWNKGAEGIPDKQIARVTLIRPGEIEPITVWENRDIIPTRYRTVRRSVYETVYKEVIRWSLEENLDLTPAITTSGEYLLQLEAKLRNGNDGGDAYVSFDEVHLSISTPDTIPPGMPLQLMAKDAWTGGAINLQWKENDDKDLKGYNVYRAEGETVFQSVAKEVYAPLFRKLSFKKVNGTLIRNNYFKDNGLVNGVNYIYKVTAVDYAENESDFSSEASAVPTLDTTSPNIPTGLLVTDARTGGRLNLGWESNVEEDLSGYVLYRANEPGGPYEKLTDLDNITTFSDNTVNNDLEYYYKLAAVDFAGNISDQTQAVKGVPTHDITPPATPENLVLKNIGTGVELKVSWDANKEFDAAGYILYRSDEQKRLLAAPLQRQGVVEFVYKDDVSKSVINDVYETSYFDSSVQRNGIYWYKIAAFDTVGNISVPSAAVMGIALDLTPPEAPEEISIDDPWSGTELLVNWAENGDGDVKGYNVYRSISPTEDYVKVNEQLLAGTSYMDTGLTHGQMYYYRLSAVDTSGNESDFSKPVGGKPYLGLAENSYDPDGVIPDKIEIELSNAILFVDQSNKNISVKAVAADVYGRPVTVSGTWMYATDFGKLKELKVISGSTVQGEFTSKSTGKANIIVKFIPDGLGSAALRATTSVKALDWNISLNISDKHTSVGSDDVKLLAMVTDQNGDPVTDPNAQVIFTVESFNKVSNSKSKKSKAGRHQEDNRVFAVNSQRIPIGVGNPDADGYVRGVLKASTVPGKNKVFALVRYQDLLAPGDFLVEGDKSKPAVVRIDNGPASYVGWNPEKVSIERGKKYKAVINAYDAFGNVLRKVEKLKLGIQSPIDGRVDFSLDGGKTWITDGQWHPIKLGTEVQFRVEGAGQRKWRSQFGYILVRIDEGGENLSPPPGVNQVNMPLFIQLAK